jgi:hypothetical protein
MHDKFKRRGCSMNWQVSVVVATFIATDWKSAEL